MNTKTKILSLLAIAAFFTVTYLTLSHLYPPNLLLEKPEKAVFTKEDRMQRDWREGGFHANRDKRKMCIYFQEKFDDHRNYYFIATYFGSIPKELSEDQKKLFKHESKIIGGKTIDLYSYATGTLKNPDRWLNIYDEMVEMTLAKNPEKPTSQLALPQDFSKKGEKANPQKISAKQCATLLKNKRFLFYTGAGLSAATGIQTGVQMSKEIGLDETKEVDQFTMNILTNPQAIIDVHNNFENRFKHIKPTPAHTAIANLAMKCNAHVVTSNIDKLHEQTGVKAWNIMSKHTRNFLFWEQPIPESGNFTYLEANPQWLKDIDFVICIGMSADVEGFLAWYKEHNPQGKIIAINTSEVPYLGNEDYFVQEDIQKVLPSVDDFLLKRETIFDKVVRIPEKIIYNIPHLPPACDEIPGLKKGFANTKDGKLYYEEEGQGVPIVLINGGPGGTHHSFHPYFSQIKDVARVIYYDQRGTGKSSRDETIETYTVQQAVEDLESLRKELKIDKWTVLGWSYGGLLAQLYTLKYPEHVSGLILGTSDVGGGTETLYIPGEPCYKANQFISQKEYEAQEAVEKMEREGKLTPAAVEYNKILRGYWKLISYYKPPKEVLIRTMLYGSNSAPGFREQMVSEISKINIQGKLRDNKIPTLIIEGKWDFLWGNLDRVNIMRKNHPHAQIEIFEKSGHMIFADEPEKFFSMLKDFLRK